jgi:LCP family protein required for cell wall assembly
VDARWQPHRDPIPPASRPARRRTDPGKLTGIKTVLVVVSLLVLAVTGYYWSTLNSWSESMTRANVIEAGPKAPDGATDILMVGMDSRTDAQGKPLSKEVLAQLTAGNADGTLNTDTLILVRIPNNGGRAIGISLPRDSYVDIPGFGTHKINSAYARGKFAAMDRLRRDRSLSQEQREVKSNEEGAKTLISTIQDLTGATIDHYAEINLLGFYDITNAVGGIEVCLNKPADDDMSGAHLPAGRQTLAGAPALAFVRQRHGLPNGDLDRIVRQQVFMAGMAKKVFSKDMLTPGSDTLDKLQAAVQKSVVLDQHWNVIEFAQQMMGFTGGNLQFNTIPVGNLGLRTPNDGYAVEVHPRDVQQFMRDLLNGSGQQQAGDTQAPGPTEAPAQQAVTVDVRNASGRTGLANQVAKTLASQGFQAGQTGNAAARPTSVVRYAQGEQQNGNQVTTALGGRVTAEEDRNVQKGHVTVLLGKDFDPGSGHQLTGERVLTMDPVTHAVPARQPAGPGADGCVN